MPVSFQCPLSLNAISQIIEGAVTLFLGILAWLFIPDFPDRNTFLTPQETAVVLKRIEEDRGDSIPDPLTRQKVFTHLRDWTLWASGTKHCMPVISMLTAAVLGIMFMCASMPACKPQACYPSTQTDSSLRCIGVLHFDHFDRDGVVDSQRSSLGAPLWPIQYFLFTNLPPQSAPPYGPAVSTLLSFPRNLSTNIDVTDTDHHVIFVVVRQAQAQGGLYTDTSHNLYSGRCYHDVCKG